jgi:hypothetical protein
MKKIIFIAAVLISTTVFGQKYESKSIVKASSFGYKNEPHTVKLSKDSISFDDVNYFISNISESSGAVKYKIVKHSKDVYFTFVYKGKKVYQIVYVNNTWGWF